MIPENNLKKDWSGILKPVVDVVNKPRVFIITGAVLIVVAAIMLFGGSGNEREGELALQQGRRAVSQLSAPIESFRRLMLDEQVQALAKMAIENENAAKDLKQYLVGRMREAREVSIHPPDVLLSDIEALGESAYIILDMFLSTSDTGLAPIQLLTHNGQRMLAGVAAIGDPADPEGFLLMLADSEALFANFNITLPEAGYIALEHNNGRFAPLTLREFGDDPGLSNMGLRLVIPGSLFRVVVPHVAERSDASGIQRLLMFLIGGLLLAWGLIKRQISLHIPVELQPDPLQLSDIDEKSTKEGTGPAGEQPEEAESVTGPEVTCEPEAVEEPAAPDEPELPEVSLPDLHFDPEQRLSARRRKAAPVELTAGIFRAYDIRGIVGQNLDAGVARQVGQAVGSLALEKDATPVVVGRDGRDSGADLVDGMVEGITSTGCDVVDVGSVPTGTLYYGAYEFGSGSGVMVTGSHNPPDYNGFKVMIGGETLSGEMIKGLYHRITSGDLRVGKGNVRGKDILGSYRERISQDIQLERPLKVVADCGNGIGGICAADVLRAIGAEVLPLYEEVDGTFPHHHPDPSEPENLVDLIQSVQLMDADLGVAFDGDADRLGVVTPAGDIIYPDRIMMLFAREILGRNPGATIIYDVKCTGHLDSVIKFAGGQSEMYKTGHSLIKNRMKEVDAPFAGEMSGHFFFSDRWYGFDCGIYSAARLLEILARDERTPQEVLDSLPNSVSTPELKIELEEGQNHEFIRQFQDEATFENARISTIDGVRADFPDGWGLVRASNTTPVLVLRFDADSEEALVRVKDAFRVHLLALDPELKLPF